MPDTNYAKALWQRNSGRQPVRDRSDHTGLPAQRPELNLQPKRSGLMYSSYAGEDPFADSDTEISSDNRDFSGTPGSDTADQRQTPPPHTSARAVDPMNATVVATGVSLQKDVVFRNYSDTYRSQESFPKTAGNAPASIDSSVAGRSSGSVNSEVDENTSPAIKARGQAPEGEPDSSQRNAFSPDRDSRDSATTTDSTVMHPMKEQRDPREINAILAELDRKMQRFTGIIPGDKTVADNNQSTADALSPEKRGQRLHNGAPQLQPRTSGTNAARSATAGKHTQVTIGTLSVEIIPATEKSSAPKQQTPRTNRSRVSRQGSIAGSAPSAGRFGLGQW